jgi:hypothetical protein
MKTIIRSTSCDALKLTREQLVGQIARMIEDGTRPADVEGRAAEIVRRFDHGDDWTVDALVFEAMCEASHATSIDLDDGSF